MTLQASPLDINALHAAARAVVVHLGSLGELETRVLGLPERTGHQMEGGVAFSVRIGGAGPGEVGLIAGFDAAAAVPGNGDALTRWEPIMAELVVTLTERVGDLEPQGLKVLASGSGSGPALDSGAICVGVFRGDQLMAAIGFVAEGSAAELALPLAPVFQALVGVDNPAVEARRMHMLRDVEMGVSVELGRTRMTVRDLLALAPGVIVELDKAAGAPVDLLVNGTLMARGEVVVIDEEFAVRISEIVTTEQDSRLGV